MRHEEPVDPRLVQGRPAGFFERLFGPRGPSPAAAASPSRDARPADDCADRRDEDGKSDRRSERADNGHDDRADAHDRGAKGDGHREFSITIGHDGKNGHSEEKITFSADRPRAHDQGNEKPKGGERGDEKGGDKDDEKPKREAKKPSRRSVHLMRISAVVVSLIIVAVVAVLVVTKTTGTNKKAKQQQQQVAKGPQLEVVKVKAAKPEHELILEGESRPYLQATIFAKVSGYLREIRVIEGTRVKAGDVMATIDSPETDQAYESARADAYNKNRIAARNRVLLRQKLISPQEAEQAFAAARMATANLRSAQEQKDYEILRAPFDGIVTARYVDPGALIPNASNAKSTQLAILDLADTSRLKIDAFIEQRYAPDVHVNMPLEMYLPDRAAERWPGRVARVSGVLDPRTRMLFVEMDFDNSASRIVAGSFVAVSMKIQRPPLLQAPIQALVTKDNGPALATLTQNNKIKLEPIEIYENDGTNVMISRGATVGQQIVLDTGAELREGDSIQPIFEDQQKPGAQQTQANQKSDMTGAAKAGQPSLEAAQSGGASSNPAGTESGTTQPAQQQQQSGKKQESQSGESQPANSKMKPSKSNTTFAPSLPRDPNE